MLPFSILNFTLYLKENPLNYLLLQCVFQVICKRLVSKRVIVAWHVWRSLSVSSTSTSTFITEMYSSYDGITISASASLSFPVTRMKLPATGMYPRITKLIFDEWQEVWNCCTGNKLHAIRSTVGYCKQKTCLSRCDTVLLNRLRIGHTR